MPAPLGDHLATDASMHLLADHLAEALAAGELEPCLLHLGSPDAAGFDLGVLPLEGRHPSELLLGTTAPDDWHAVGVACSGWAYHVADRHDPDRRRHRVHIVTLLSRSGEHAHRSVAEEPSLNAKLAEVHAPEGEQSDLLHRVLGLPTPPPPVPSSAYWATHWLAELLADDAPVATLAEAVERHPAMQLAQGNVALTEADVEDVLGAFHRVVTWPRMRQMAAEGRFEVPELHPQDAPWLDDGAFARFLLNRSPSLQLLRARAAAVLAPEVAEPLESLLRRLHVPDCSWPDVGDQPAA